MEPLRERVRAASRRLGARLGEELACRIASRLGMDPRPSSGPPVYVDPDSLAPRSSWVERDPYVSRVHSPESPLHRGRSASARPRNVPHVPIHAPGGPVEAPLTTERTRRTVPTLDRAASIPQLPKFPNGALHIFAEPLDRAHCRLHVGHPFAENHPPRAFDEPTAVDEGSLVESLFELPELTSLRFYRRTLTLIRARGLGSDWTDLARAAAARIRGHIASGQPVLPDLRVSLTDELAPEPPLGMRPTLGEPEGAHARGPEHLRQLDITLLTGGRPLRERPVVVFNGYEFVITPSRGGTRAGEAWHGTFAPDREVHELLLRGPMTGEWSVARIELGFELADRRAYGVVLGGTVLDRLSSVDLWRGPPADVFEV